MSSPRIVGTSQLLGRAVGAMLDHPGLLKIWGPGAQGWVRTQAERKLATLRACGAPGGSQEELARALRRRVRLIMNTGA